MPSTVLGKEEITLDKTKFPLAGTPTINQSEEGTHSVEWGITTLRKSREPGLLLFYFGFSEKFPMFSEKCPISALEQRSHGIRAGSRNT